jgi:hypothetical protein
MKEVRTMQASTATLFQKGGENENNDSTNSFHR